MNMQDDILSARQRRCIPNVTFELIPICNLVSNQNYQRRLSEDHIRKALEDFDVYQINPVKVSRRGGVNYVFDGQHTIEIVATKSQSRETPVWCMIYDDLEYKEEAQIFADQQKHVKNLLPIETFVAHIEAGDDKQKMIEATIKSYGLSISQNQKTNSICAVSTLEKIYDKYGRNVLDTTIRLAVLTWEGELNSFSGSILMGIAKIINVYGDTLNEEIFKDQVGKMSVKSLVRNAKERRPGALGYAEAMVIAYNANRRKHGLSLKKLYGTQNKGNQEDIN